MPDSKQRYLFIDLLRFVTAFFMVQGHVFDALLSPQVKSHHLYYLHDFFHGFVAPAFLFASGVAYGASTMKRWEEHTVWGTRTRRRVAKFLGLIAVGYALHLPYFSLRKTLAAASSAEIKSLLQSDVLQCVGVTLLLLQMSILLTKERKTFKWLAAGIAASVIFSAPLMWSRHFSGVLPLALVSYLSPETGSWFPLFPWAGYILCGVLIGAVVAKARTPAHALSITVKSAALGAGLLLLSWVVMYLPFSFYPDHDFWKSNPAMFFVRLSVVSLVGNCIFLAQHWWQATPRLPLIIGRHSLFIYILHLVIVYGSVVNRGLAQRIGPTLQLSQTLGVAAAVFATVSLVTILWYQLKTRSQTAASWITTAGATVFIVAFLIRPW